MSSMMSGVNSDGESIDRLIQRAASGDEDSFRQLMEGLRPDVRKFLERRIDRRLQSRLDASDILQQTFLRVHQRIKDFAERRPMPLKVWLFKTAMEQLREQRIKHLQRERRAATLELGLPEQSSVMLAGKLATHTTPSRIAMQREKLKAVATMIDRMGDADRDILLMRHVDDLKFDEIGAILEINAANARQRHARAVVRLRQLCIANDISRGN